MPELAEQLRRCIESAAPPVHLDELISRVDRRAPNRASAPRRRARSVLLGAAAGVLVLALAGGIALAIVRSSSDERRPSVRTPSEERDFAHWRTIASVPPELNQVYGGFGDYPKAVSAASDVYVVSGHDYGPQIGIIAGRYDTQRGSWSVLPRGPVTQRANAIVIWTGRELIVWGGDNGLPSGPYRDGAAYDPATNRWWRIADAPLAASNASSSVWSGTEVIIWGGRTSREPDDVGLAYNPSTNTWRSIAPAPIPNRPYPAAVWADKEMIVWGGCAVEPPSNPGPCDNYAGNERTDGAAYDPATNSWRMLTPSPLPPRPKPHGVWTGREMLIWGGDAGPASDEQMGAAYDPSADRWHLLPPAPLPRLRDFSMVWTGNEAIVAAGQSTMVSSQVFGAAYDPKKNAWQTLPKPPYSPTALSAVAWTDAGLFAYGGARANGAPAILPR